MIGNVSNIQIHWFEIEYNFKPCYFLYSRGKATKHGNLMKKLQTVMTCF